MISDDFSHDTKDVHGRREIESELRLSGGRGPRHSTATRLQLVGALPLDAPPTAIDLCTVLRCLARVWLMTNMAGVREGGGLGEGGVVRAGQGGGEGGAKRYRIKTSCISNCTRE